MARVISVSKRVMLSWKVEMLVISVSVKVTVTWVRESENVVMVTEVKSLWTRAKNCSSIRMNTSPVTSSPPSEVMLPELTRVVSKVCTSVIDFWFTVKYCRLIRMADDASSVVVTEVDPEVI